MRKNKIADLLEQLIYEIRQNGKITLSSTENDKIIFAEGVIRELREDNKTKQDGGTADDGE